MSLEKTFFTEVSWKLVRDEGGECVLTIRGLLRFDFARFSFAFSDAFVRETNGNRRCCYRNERWEIGQRLVSLASARSSFPFPSHGRRKKRAAADTSCRENARTPDESKVEEFHDDGRTAGEIGWRGNNRRIDWLSSRKIENTRAPTDVQAHDGLTSAWKNPQFEMAVGWGMPVHRKNLLRPIPPVLEQSAIHHRTTAVPSSYCAKDEGTKRRRFPFVRLSLSAARGWQTWLSIASFQGTDISIRISSLTNAFVRKF